MSKFHHENVSYISTDTLGETTPAAAQRFARFCTEAARRAGPEFEIEFDIDDTISGEYSDAGDEISNICWECDWYGNGPLRNKALNDAASKIRAFAGGVNDCRTSANLRCPRALGPTP